MPEQASAKKWNASTSGFPQVRLFFDRVLQPGREESACRSPVQTDERVLERAWTGLALRCSRNTEVVGIDLSRRCSPRPRQDSRLALAARFGHRMDARA